MPKIIYSVTNKFPEDSGRAYGIGKALRDAGYEVRYMCINAGRSEDIQSDGSYQYSGFQYVPLLPIGIKMSYVKNIYTYFTEKLKLDWLRRSNLNDVAAIIVSGGSVYYLSRLHQLCQNRGIPLIGESTDWFQLKLFLKRYSGLYYYCNSELKMRLIYPIIGNMIIISSYLEEYYQKKGCRTLRLPHIVDTQDILPRLDANKENPLILSYAGVIRKNDTLNNVIEALLRIDYNGNNVRIRIAGPSRNQILNFPALRTRGIKTLPGCIESMGWLSHEEAFNLVKESEFVTLLRPVQRFAQAGFPSKVPECMVVGTPLICNLTSDLGEYIRQGIESIICTDHTPEEFTIGLRRALAMNWTQRCQMRLAARRRAERSFDYRNYVGALADFIEEIHR
ncbi:MAG: glycosyltransferase [Candidatus Electryonea clarkiae]|nr:glycosyltransferase [Candidatus Electryonea clarkiae]MDP8289164.1 glycosyltransferase [Candidatus Electryonea clarkiae]